MGVRAWWIERTRRRYERRAARIQAVQAARAAKDDIPEDPRWSALRALVASAIVAVLVLAGAVSLLVYLADHGDAGPETALSLVFVATAVVLILVVCTLTIVFKRLRLTDSAEAMGLPRGSVRAVIALLLIMLFFISAVFLFNSTRPTTSALEANRRLRGITTEQLAALPPAQIATATRRVVRGAALYDVALLPNVPDTAVSDDIAKQLVTTVATLVTAVAAFYFGANSVTSALKDAAGGITGGITGGGTTGGGTGAGTTGGGTRTSQSRGRTNPKI